MDSGGEVEDQDLEFHRTNEVLEDKDNGISIPFYPSAPISS